MTQFLTQNELEHYAPSIFTKSPYQKMGESYEVISTFEVLQGLFDMGFGVTKAMETKARKPERTGFSKHMLRLRRKDEEEINGYFPEVILINSHDGSTSYQLKAGIYRMVCSNGMIVGDEMFSQKVRHQGNVVDRVGDACSDIIEVFPTAVKTVSEWQDIELSPGEQLAFADAAKGLRWDETKKQVDSEKLLRKRRNQDNSRDLWTTFNVVQENMIKGGVTVRDKQTKQTRRSKGVKSVNENSKLNTALWKLTENMASLAR